MASEFKIKHGLIVDGALSASFAYTTASWSTNAVTASNANTASFLLGTVSNATFATSASWASQSLSSSYVAGSNVVGKVATAGTADTTVSASWSSQSLSSSYIAGANVVGTVANASTAYSSNYATQSLFATSSISASYATTASNLNGWNFVNTASTVQTLGPNSQSLILAVSTASFLAAFFDYAIQSGSNARAGTVFGTWVNGSVVYSEFSTIDVGVSNDVTMSLGLSASFIQLSASVNISTWNIRALARFI